MKKIIYPSEISGKINAPPSKSFMQRGIAGAILSDGETNISGPSLSEDSLAALDIARKFGRVVHNNFDSITIDKKTFPINSDFNCGESGLSLRMFAPIAALEKSQITLRGQDSLLGRTISMIEAPLKNLGVKCFTNNGFPPITVQGPMTGGEIFIDGSVSSQFLTGLLFALPTVNSDSIIHVKNLSSRPYIDMTIEVIKKFGVNIENQNYETFIIKGNQKYKCNNFQVEKDWSGASFFFVAAAIAGTITISGLDLQSTQGDKIIIETLINAGAYIEQNAHDITVSKQTLRPFTIDLTDTPDLFPPLVVLALFCPGKSIIKGVKRLRSKESDRGEILLREFSSEEKQLIIRDDIMEIIGNDSLMKGRTINPQNDHRIAMAGAIAALRSENGFSIESSNCVNKSYPSFFEHLDQITSKK